MGRPLAAAPGYIIAQGSPRCQAPGLFQRPPFLRRASSLLSPIFARSVNELKSFFRGPRPRKNTLRAALGSDFFRESAVPLPEKNPPVNSNPRLKSCGSQTKPLFPPLKSRGFQTKTLFSTRLKSSDFKRVRGKISSGAQFYSPSPRQPLSIWVPRG